MGQGLGEIAAAQQSLRALHALLGSWSWWRSIATSSCSSESCSSVSGRSDAAQHVGVHGLPDATGTHGVSP
jgi:hypothetical protein